MIQVVYGDGQIIICDRGIQNNKYIFADYIIVYSRNKKFFFIINTILQLLYRVTLTRMCIYPIIMRISTQL
jgi:hypothetical protein